MTEGPLNAPPNRDDPIPEGRRLGARFTGYLLVIIAGITVAIFAALQVAQIVIPFLAGLVLLITFQIRSEIPDIQKRVATTLDAAKQLLATQPFGITEGKLNELVDSSGKWLQDNAAGLVRAFFSVPVIATLNSMIHAAKDCRVGQR